MVCDGYSTICEPVLAGLTHRELEYRSGVNPPTSKGIPALAGLGGRVEV